jgi:Tol biopolymer transport system component
MNPDGTGITRLTDSKRGDFEPSWARDGKKIAFTSLRDGKREIYVMNANASGQTRLTINAASDNQPDW